MNPMTSHRFIPVLVALFLAGAARAEIVSGKIYAEADSEKLTAMADLAKKEPTNYRAQLRLARRYAAAGRIANAEVAYGKVLEAVPGSLEAYHELALLYIRNARYGDAERVSGVWLSKDPKSYYGHFCLADALSLKGDLKKSLTVLKELNRCYPSDIAVLSAMKLRYDHLGMTGDSAAISRLIAEILAE